MSDQQKQCIEYSRLVPRFCVITIMKKKKNSNYFFPNYEIKVINAISDIWYNQSCLKKIQCKSIELAYDNFLLKNIKTNKNPNFEFIRITANIN